MQKVLAQKIAVNVTKKIAVKLLGIAPEFIYCFVLFCYSLCNLDQLRRKILCRFSPSPFQKDFVPSSERGRWNAAESISSMSWSGSAVIGG